MPAKPKAPLQSAPLQSNEQVAAALEAYLAEFPAAVLSENGKVLFDLRTAKYTLATEHNRCTLHLWNEEGNLVRRISAAVARGKALRLTSHRFGQAKPSTLEFSAERDRRTPSTRETTRTRYVALLERVLTRQFGEEGWRPEAFRTAMDLEKSFGPAYARGLLTRATQSWAVIAVNDEEAVATIDGILTFGILWLEHLRQAASVRRQIVGLRLVLPRGTAAVTLARLAWLRNPEQFGLLELDQREETLTPRDASDAGNLNTRTQPAPNPERAQARFADASARVLGLVPAAAAADVTQRLRTPTELAFLLHGLEFARVRLRASAESFNRVEQITFGAGAAETALTPETEDGLRHLVEQLALRRHAAADKRDPLYRLQPERWLEDSLRRDLTRLDPHLVTEPVYAQVPTFQAASTGFDRGMLDLLAVDEDGRLAVLELKAEEDPQLALQGLDYWVRVRWHHMQPADAQSGLGEFQAHGYFPAQRLSAQVPRLYLVAPALRIHPATETVLRYLSPQVPWTLIALDERWRQQIRPVWRKRHTD